MCDKVAAEIGGVVGGGRGESDLANDAFGGGVGTTLQKGADGAPAAGVEGGGAVLGGEGRGHVVEVARGSPCDSGDAGALFVVAVLPEFTADAEDVKVFVEVEMFAVGLGAGLVEHEEDGGDGVAAFESGHRAEQGGDGEGAREVDGEG